MANDFLNFQPRNFKPLSIPALSKEALDGVNAALAAISAWRNQLADTNRKNGKEVIEKMAAAATAMGWPEQVVETARTQMQSVAEMQTRAMDHMMDAWEKQVKLPNAMTASPSEMLSKLCLSGGLPSTGNGTAINPVEVWMRLAEQWQNNWTDAMGLGRKH